MSLESILKEVKKKFSKDNPDICHDPAKRYEVIPSGVFGFDLCTGIGGFPRGRITEIIAMESTGKSSLVYATMGKLQKDGGTSVLIDAEQSFDPLYAKNTFGLVEDGKTFVVFQPTCIEEADEILTTILKSGEKIDLLALDSIESAKPRALIDNSLEEGVRIGIHAQFVGKYVTKLKTAAFRENWVVLLTNQMRHQIAANQFVSLKGVATGYDPKGQYTTPGGMAPRFLASMRFELKYAGKEEGTGKLEAISEELGLEKATNLINVVNIKNKCGRPFQKMVVHYNHQTSNQLGGWDRGKDILGLLKKLGRVKQASTKFTYKGLNESFENIGPKVESEKMMTENPKLMKDAEELILSLRSGDTLLERASETDITPGLKDGQEDLSGITIVPMN